MFSISIARCLGLTAAVALFSMPASASLLYGISSALNGAGKLYTIDSSTGAASLLIGLTGVTNTISSDIELLNGTVYATNISTDFGVSIHFGTIDTTTGAFTALDNQDGKQWIGLALNVATGTFFALDDSVPNFPLYSVTSTGAFTLIGDAGLQLDDLAYDSNHGVLYALSSVGALVTLDTTSGAGTVVGTTGLGFSSFGGLGYDASTDTLYLNDAGNSNLYTVNPTTAAVTLVGANGATNIDGLADVQAPEPATWILAGVGLVWAGIVRRRARV